MKYGCSLKSSPAASNLLNQLWGCFPANFCLDTSTSLATAWPEAIYVHLMLTGAAGLSCWWNTVILFLITVCSMWDSAGLRETIRDLRVCVHSVANKENRPALWKKKHLFNTPNRNLSTQMKDFFLITLQMSSDMMSTEEKSLRHVQSTRTCVRDFRWAPKTQITGFSCLYMHWNCRVGGYSKSTLQNKMYHTGWTSILGLILMIDKNPRAERRNLIFFHETSWHFILYSWHRQTSCDAC